MKSFPRFEIRALCEKGYFEGYSKHGDFNLDLEAYANRLSSIVENHLGANPAVPLAEAFFCKLHTNDLYLTVACAQGSETAWDCFAGNYGRYIRGLACFTSGSTDLGSEVADQIMVNMFLPDQSGSSRIASFDGRISLAAWLRVIVTYQAFKERKRKCNNLEPLEYLPEMTDEPATDRIYATLRTNRYELLIDKAIKEAVETLNARERAMLLLRYEEQLQNAEIARIFKVNPSAVTRALQAAQRRIRDEVASILSCKHGLSGDAVRECFTDIVENSRHSIIALIK